jgi:glutamate-ammonia-ligase adenylyltransferase
MNLNKSSKFYHVGLNRVDSLVNSDRIWLREQPQETQDAIIKVFASSRFVADTCLSQPNLVTDLFSSPCSYHKWETQLSECFESVSNEAELAKQLRLFRHREMAKIVARDFASQSIEASLRQVSDLADVIIFQTYQWLYAQFCEKYGAPENNCPLCIIAMGKLGGRELNFSSDIDLIFAYPSKGETQGKRKTIEHSVFFTRLAQRLIYALDHISTEGQAYRVDMRLRPLGESGPLVMHFAAFSDYYHEQAREWERFAMLKARVINPASSFTETLENIIQPFVFKRYLDFTTLESLRAMKDKIFADSRRRQLGSNIKLGEGGIREAEFFVQYFQLIHGGQSAVLQTKSWLEAALNICKEGFITEQEYLQLRGAYLYLRKTEHALQQRNNEQTQTLPDTQEEWEAMAWLSHAESVEAMKQHVADARQLVHQHFNALFAEQIVPAQLAQRDEVSRAKMLWLGDHEQEELIQHLDTYFGMAFSTAQGESHAHNAANAILSFKQKCERAHLSDRAHLLIDDLMPLVINESLNQGEQCHLALERVLSILQAIIGRTTYLDLLFNHPQVRQQLFIFCTASPWMTEQVRRFPLLLDELLSQAYLQYTGSSLTELRLDYEQELSQHLLRVERDDIEHHMNVLRQFKLCQQFRIAAADIHGSLPIEQVSDHLTLLAEVIVNYVIHSAYSQTTEKHGFPESDDSKLETNPIDHFSVIAYGKLGGYELGYGSDLDLVFVHNSPQNAQTNGRKEISARQFYIKVAQRAMHLFNTKTLLGELYEADLRLRPAGNSGLLCCHISGFEHYQHHEAWTWEHQALVRARVIFGGETLRDHIERLRLDILSRIRAIPALKNDIVKMRRKLFEHNSNGHKHNFKHGKGGITDIEFLSQFFVLAYSTATKELTQWSDNLRIIESAEKAGLLEKGAALTLRQAYLLQRNHQHRSVLKADKLNNKKADNERSLQQSRKQIHSIWCSLLSDYTLNR